jgi:AbiV family abortive infection protein
MDKSRFIEAAAASLSNGRRLLYDAESLSDPEHSGTSFALATIAQEEFAKAFLMFLVSRDVVVWNSIIYRATRDHACKQLLGLVMSYINPDLDELLRRDKEWLIEHEERKNLFAAYDSSADAKERDRIWRRIQEIGEKHDSLPRSVADAINILRHEKIGRWEFSRWVWADAPVYDEIAMRLGEGKLDREKQDALYVRLGRNGQVAKTPAQVKNEDAAAAIETANRLRSLIEGLLSGTTGASIEYEKIESAFKTVFASLSETDEQSLGES